MSTERGILWPIFICGDSRGDQILAGLEAAGLLDEGSRAQYQPSHRRTFRSANRGSVVIDLLDPVRD